MAGLLFGILAASVLGTGMVRRYALARSVLDIPNARSSHATPTPRGGGVAIVCAFTIAVTGLAVAGSIEGPTAVALVGSGLLVAGIGFVDDHRHVPARWRLAVHFLAATWGLVWLGGIDLPGIPNLPEVLGWVVNGAVVFGLIWLLNLYNFMDGIDGIAGIEAVSVTSAIAAILATLGSAHAVWILPAALAAASLGFLAWNFPPARIFMGDAGSGFVGLMLGLLALLTSRGRPEILWCWAILLGVFTVDATVTLIVRIQRGDRVSEAHRTHAYQHAALRRGGHRPVTLAVGLINGCWLFPIALLVAHGRIDGLGGLAMAYLPLCLLTFWLGAGRPSPSR